jgi:hypothetical protein
MGAAKAQELLSAADAGGGKNVMLKARRTSNLKG